MPDADRAPRTGPSFSPALLTDLYELTMLQAYFDEGMTDEAVFSLFVRRLPEQRNYLIACGLDDVLRYVETLRFDGEALTYLASLKRFSSRFLGYLEGFRFTGDVHAVPEGTPVFANEPILEVVAPIGEAQFIETLVMNQIHVQTLLASKAARVVEAAQGREVVDFGFRRMHGIDAGMKAARAFHIAGVHATSNVAAGQAYGLRVSGTMAHSYIQSHDDEREAFRAFARLYPGTVLLVDTYDTIAGVQKVIDLARELGGDFRISAVRLDSGDLIELSRRTRHMLDDAGLRGVRIVASNNLNEYRITELVAAGAPIDGFGVGAGMGVSPDAPSLDIVYKLVEYAGRGRIKLSADKPVLPGRKQVFRLERDDVAEHDVLARYDEQRSGRPLMRQVMQRGTRTPDGRVALDEARATRERELRRLPPALREIRHDFVGAGVHAGPVQAREPYRVEISAALERDLDAIRQRYSA